MQRNIPAIALALACLQTFAINQWWLRIVVWVLDIFVGVFYLKNGHKVWGAIFFIVSAWDVFDIIRYILSSP